MDRQLRDALEQVINYLDANGLREDWLSQFSDALETPELLSRYLSLRGKIQRIIE